MRPHGGQNVRDPPGQRLRGPDIGRWTGPPGGGQAVSPRTASQLQQLMLDVVQSGTGTSAAIDGVQVGGKTGTAQTGTADDPGPPIVWFVGFAEDDVAIAVMLRDIGPDATGGRDAAPVARQVISALLD
jgi:penicillin-binding protein A